MINLDDEIEIRKRIDPVFRGIFEENENLKRGIKGNDLLDYFAAKAMQGMLANKFSVGTKEELAEDSFNYAEAMMKEREKRLK
jgi:hypothetical protein